MTDKNQTVAVTMLAVTSAIGVYTSLLPPLSEVRQTMVTSSNYRTQVEDLRIAELAAGGLAVAVGITASSLAGTPVPAIASVVAALGIAAMYESVLRSTPAESKNTK